MELTRRAALIILGVLAVLLGCNSLYGAILQLRPPMYYDRTWTDTPVVRLGATFRAHYAFTRLRVCKTEIQTFMRDDATGEIVLRRSYPGAAVQAGTYRDILNAFELPPPKAPGRYTFETIAINDCLEGTHSVVAPPIRFEVVP